MAAANKESRKRVTKNTCQNGSKTSSVPKARKTHKAYNRQGR